MMNTAHQTPAPLPGRSFYGFALYVASWTAILAYLTWALVPHAYLSGLGITYLPHRLWGVLFPAIVVGAVVGFVSLVYPALNWLLTASTSDVRSLQDQHTLRREHYDSKDFDWQKELTEQEKEAAVPPVYDMDISQVSRMLYYQR